MFTLEFPRPPSVALINRFLLVILSLLAPASLSAVAAQNVESRPVARLVTSAKDTDYAKPRRVVSISVSTGPEAEATSSITSPSINEASKYERRAFEITNQMRVKNGLAPYAWDAELCRMARRHSESMAREGFFSHKSPEGMQMRERARAAGILRFKVLGENIAYNQNFDDPGGFVVERWMISPGHRANILSREFRSSAVGSFVASDGRVYFTQVFILR
ncbi:MAG: CAP domain-containing protein [Pyrinomonadaceae bacterium]